MFTDLKEDSLGILPRLSLCVDYAQSNLKGWVFWSRFNSQPVDVALLRIKQILQKEESMATQNPSLLVVRIGSKQLLKGVGCIEESLLKNPDFSFSHQEPLGVLVLDKLKSHVCNSKHITLKQEINQVKEKQIILSGA